MLFVADYAIGDVQGCYEPLMRLLDKVHFDESTDQLWFVGDLVNRGPESLKVLRFIQHLSRPAFITLGNHDLYLLSQIFTPHIHQNTKDTLKEILNADDKEELGHWLRHQPLVIYSKELQVVMSHAGIPPYWNLEETLNYATEVEKTLKGENFKAYLEHMWGNEPSSWSESLQGYERLRFITNSLTRMRTLNAEGHLALHYKKSLETLPQGLLPWFKVPHRKAISTDIVFGHWAALEGLCETPHIYAIDTGCVWGKTLTALRLQDKARFTIHATSLK